MSRAKGKRLLKTVAVDPVRARTIQWVMLIYFFSGVCSLIDEVVWVRLIKLTLGNTVYASSVVVSVFMGGLALGAYIMSRHADRIQKRLRLYAILEGVATLSALAIPWVLRVADAAYGWFFVALRPAPGVLLVVQVIVSAAILLVPTVVMGSTLPLLGRFITSLQNQVGPLVGRLYALNMLGAALGCFLAGFILIRLLGVMGALYTAAGINFLVACAGWLLYRNQDTQVQPAPAEPPGVKLAPVSTKTIGSKTSILLLGAFLSGLISIGYEIVWMRAISLELGTFTYVFSAVLTIYLLGNVIGAWIGSNLSRRLKNPGVGFGISLGLLGILGAFWMPWFAAWNLDAKAMVFSPILKLMDNPTLLKTVFPLLDSAFLVLLPSVLMGIGFPLALQAWSSRQRQVGRTTGMVYAVNTIGAVLGGVLTGFLLIAWVGTAHSLAILGLSGLVMGTILVWLFVRPEQASTRPVVLIVGGILTALTLVLPAPIDWDRLIGQRNTRLISLREGITGTFSVHQVIGRWPPEKLLSVSGVPIAGDERDIRSAQQTLGHLSLFLHKNPQRVLSVGFGSGETSYCMAGHGLNDIDCVEIAPELVEIALEYFNGINLGSQLDRKVNMIFMDAKNYLHLTDQKYDIIVNDADMPTQPGSAPLFAKEHFRNALEHLNPAGLFMTKLHMANISTSGFISILGTFLEVYPHVTAWFPATKPYHFIYLVGSRDPQEYSVKHIEEELSLPGVRQTMDALRFRDSLDLLSCYLGDQDDIRRFIEEYELNSDYTPYVEFNLDAEHNISTFGSLFQEFTGIVRGNSLLEKLDWSGVPSGEQVEWMERFQQIQAVTACILMAHKQPDFPTQVINVHRGSSIMPDYPGISEMEIEVLANMGSMFQRGGITRVLHEMNAILAEHDDVELAWLIKSLAHRQRKEIRKALQSGIKAVELAPQNAINQHNLGTLWFVSGEIDRAATNMAEAVRLAPERPDFHFDYGSILLKKGDVTAAGQEFRETLRLNPNHAGARQKLQRFPKANARGRG